MTAKNFFVYLTIIITSIGVAYLGYQIYQPASSTTPTPTPSLTPTNTPITQAPETMDIGPYESCNSSAECVAANVPSLDNPKMGVTQCLNSSILQSNPGFALSSEELAELADIATCSCEQNYCQFTRK